jgi:hypothetical protein
MEEIDYAELAALEAERARTGADIRAEQARIKESNEVSIRTERASIETDIAILEDQKNGTIESTLSEQELEHELNKNKYKLVVVNFELDELTRPPPTTERALRKFEEAKRKAERARDWLALEKKFQVQKVRAAKAQERYEEKRDAALIKRRELHASRVAEAAKVVEASKVAHGAVSNSSYRGTAARRRNTKRIRNTKRKKSRRRSR